MEVTISELADIVERVLDNRKLSKPQPAQLPSEQGLYRVLKADEERRRALQDLGEAAGVGYDWHEAAPSFLARVAAEVRELKDLEDLRDRLAKSNETMLNDLGELLEVLGMGNHARPDSPHVVMQQAIAEARKLKAASGWRNAAPEVWLERCEDLSSALSLGGFLENENVSEFLGRAARQAAAYKQAAGITWDDYELDSKDAVFSAVGNPSPRFRLERGKTLGSLVGRLARYEAEEV